MCLSPNMIADGALVACRKCWQCRQNRIDEWVGRCIAESKTSVATTSLTLTYGRDAAGNESHERSAILTYSDVQKYFKQIRNRGYPCRYLMTGELGSEKGRAHWHGIVFWQQKVPTSMLDYGSNSWHPAARDTPVDVPIVWNQRFNEPCWVHGYSFWQPVTYGHEKGSIAYVCKYIQKDIEDTHSQSKLAMSKRPPIGSDYFVTRAQRFVDERIAPQDAHYQFPLEAKRKDGKPVTFMLRGKLEQIFVQAFIDKWHEQVGTAWPDSPYLNDALARTIKTPVWSNKLSVASLRVAPDRWSMQPPFGHTYLDIQWDDVTSAPMVRTPEKTLWYGPNEKGLRGWREARPAKLPTVSRAGGLEHLPPPQSPALRSWLALQPLLKRVQWLQPVQPLTRYRLSKLHQMTGKKSWLRLCKKRDNVTEWLLLI
jgi:hypothetical protein